MKIAHRLLAVLVAALLALACLSPACHAPIAQHPDGPHDEVLDTSSPDEGAPMHMAALASTAATGLVLHESDSGSTIADRRFTGTAYVGPIVRSSARETLSAIRYLRWSVTNDIAAGQHARWGILTYNEVGVVYERLRISGIDGEHAIYQHSPRGDVNLLDCIVYDIGAQGFQQTWRGAETSDPLGYLVTGTHRLIRCTFLKCGQPRGYGRASYALSFFGWQAVDGQSPRQFWDCPVELVDVVVEHDSGGRYELRGALLVELRPSLLVRGGRTNYVGTSDRDFWHIHAVRSVRVENHYAHGPTGKFIDIDGADSVVFTSPGFNGGDARVRIDGVVVGTSDDEIDWHR